MNIVALNNRLLFILMAIIISSCGNSEIDSPIVVHNSTSSQSKETSPNANEPLIKSFSILQRNNKNNLSSDIPCDIRKDSIIECFARNTLNKLHLKVSFESAGDSVVLSKGHRINSGKDSIDFEKNIVLTVVSQKNKKNYHVTLYPYTGLPFIFIETLDGNEVVSEVTSKDAYARIVSDPTNPSLGELLKCSIIGHGNSTWSLPKKPYTLKFEKKTSLFTFPTDKSWLLIANHYDTTMVRNYIANYISGLSNISYTPRNQFVELFFNGKHRGTYQLFEKIKVSKYRVNIAADDFLLEVDNHPREKDVYLSVNHLPNQVKIHSPDVTPNDSNYNYIDQLLKKFDNALFSESFLDEKNGYKHYIDIDALVEWYVVTEITKNASNRANWYMTYERNGKLKTGPFWDYDLAFGNTLWGLEANEIPEFWTNSLPWFERFLKDTVFVQRAVKRFEYFYSKKEVILKKIDEMATFLNPSVVYNNKLWNVFDCKTCSEEEILKLYNAHVLKMKEWIDARFEWLKQNLVKR